MSGPGDGRSPSIVVGAGPPALVVAVAAPVVALALVGLRAAREGLASTPDDPAPPWVLAVLTVGLAVWVAWRSLTQRAGLEEASLACRNLLTTFEVPWDRVERLQVRRRAGLVTVEVWIRGLRRPHRVGAATRFAGDGAEAVADVLLAHPLAGRLLVDGSP